MVVMKSAQRGDEGKRALIGWSESDMVIVLFRGMFFQQYDRSTIYGTRS
jgi:hypothetical protein